MRVIAGEAKGRRLRGPPSHDTRPMADKIKGAVFNMLGSLGIEPDRVLDLFAGTGNIGIEALSRGASSAVFVERARDPCEVIRENLRTTGFSERGTVHQASVMSYLESTSDSFDFVVLDPPYADPQIVSTLEFLARSAVISDGAVVLIGHSPRVTVPGRAGRLERIRERCHGDSCFSIYERAADDDVTRPVDVAGGQEIP